MGSLYKPFLLLSIICCLAAPLFVLTQIPSASGEDGATANTSNCRRPNNDGELRYWLTTMVYDFNYTVEEMSSATCLSSQQVTDALHRFGIDRSKSPGEAANVGLKIRPYPGGRHPRVGFLEGAVGPQRETKFAAFCPWDNSSYVVADVPEAIWSNLGLTYLAHTHVPTIWSKQGIELERLEWHRTKEDGLDIERRLPNGIKFGANVRPDKQAVHMALWLTNGTSEVLSGLRVQNCILLKGAKGFGQTNLNKFFSGIYACCHDEDGKHWIITAWYPGDRTWANERCPCLHSDPKFPDCAPGATQRLTGWLSFYEGIHIEDEVRRIESTGWHKP